MVIPMSSYKSRPIVLVAGGSGGHVFPAIALAEYAHHHALPVILITDARGSRFIEKDRSFFSHIEIVAPASLRTSFSTYHKIRRLYKQYNPNCILGFGGITTVLPLLMARFYGIGCAIHQSDAVLGRANRLLAPLMDGVFVGHGLECYAKHISSNKPHKWRTIGTPVRHAFTSVQPHTDIQTPLKILILGGSQGAKIWSTLLPDALSMLDREHQLAIQICHQSPKDDISFLTDRYRALSLGSFRVAPFFPNMAELLSWSHVVFSRAGASTLAELAHCHRPSFLVPYPLALDNHQYFNARSHSHHYRAWMSTESELNASELASKIMGWLDKPDELLYGEKQTKILPPVNACSELLSFCTSTTADSFYRD